MQSFSGFPLGKVYTPVLHLVPRAVLMGRWVLAPGRLSKEVESG